MAGKPKRDREPPPLSVKDPYCRYCHSRRIKCIRTYSWQRLYRCLAGCIDPETGKGQTFKVMRVAPPPSPGT